jgi:hypothetical protein
MPPRSDQVIPNVIVRPFIKEYLKKIEMGLITQSSISDLTNSKGRHYSKLEMLAAESGVSTRRIYDILNLDKNCLIVTADKLFCAMDKPYLWYTEEELAVRYKRAA